MKPRHLPPDRLEMRIDVELIADRLFADDEARSRIVQDYGIGKTPGHGEHLTGMVIDSIAWPMRADPLAATVDNGAVFRAAVWALGR